ncbi:hypothetical protein SBA7_500002 [Candidatus Sulfotelmatobacter sp. SbA7]|nr:hypothetical protein SBA7_500002 [Candidatus Sulfotelmatobacter sp. SbA7]
MNVNRKPNLEFCKGQDQLLTRTGRTWPQAGMQFVPCVKAELNSRESEASMIERHRSDRRWSTSERFAQCPQLKGVPDPRRATDLYETNSSSNQARHPDWALIGLLTFVVFSSRSLEFHNALIGPRFL